MFFKNILAYRLADTAGITSQTLLEALEQHPAKPCTGEQSTYGFAVLAEPAAYARIYGDFVLLAGQKEERVLPATVVREETKKRIAKIEREESRKVYGKEKAQIKDEAVAALSPRAFTRKALTWAAFDLAEGLLYVDASSAGKAEDLLGKLREALGSLPVRPLLPASQPETAFTLWLKEKQTPAGFVVLNECELRDPAEDGGTVRIKGDDLFSEEVESHLSAGKRVTSLALEWDEQLTFKLDGGLAVKKLRFSELLHEQAVQDAGESGNEGEFDASVVLMMQTLRKFMSELLQVFGGEREAV